MVDTAATSRTEDYDSATLIRGVSPVLQVPFRDDGEVDRDGFDRVVAHVLSCGVSSVMFPGYASEFLKLSADERRDLYEILLGHTRARRDVAAICAVQDHGTRPAVEQARWLVEAGADAINVLPPYQMRPSTQAVRGHITAVAAAVAPATVVLQYAPELTGTSLDAATIAAISRAQRNLRLVKVESAPAGRLIQQLQREEPALPALLGNGGLQLPDGLRRGAVGVQPGCSATEVYQEIWRRYANGEHERAFDVYRRLLPYLSYWALTPELMVAAEKLVSARRGLFASAHCRHPGYLLDEEETQMVERFLAEFADLLPPLDGAHSRG